MGSEGRGVGRAIALGAVATLWVTTCVGGLAALAWYQATPGTAAPAADWPAHSRVARAASADTLVLFVHPKCPCSRATIENLAVLMAHCPPGHLRAVVLLVRPAGMPAG